MKKDTDMYLPAGVVTVVAPGVVVFADGVVVFVLSAAVASAQSTIIKTAASSRSFMMSICCFQRSCVWVEECVCDVRETDR